VTNPFQSISEADGQKSFKEALNVFQTKVHTCSNGAAERAPFDGNEQSCRVETGLADLSTGTKLPHTTRSRQPLRGGDYEPIAALRLMNAHFLISKDNQETTVYRISDDGSATPMPPEQFKLLVQNIFVELKVRGANKLIPVERHWKESQHRNEKNIVFKPDGGTEPNEFNRWRGFGVVPQKGWQKQRRLLRHIREIICCRDKKKFKYLIRYLAWAVQHPDKHAGVVIVLKSSKQGTGKSTLGVVMLRIFGPHGALIDDKERLLGRFTDWLEDICFVLAEEILWAGDHKAADKLKSVITGETIQIERKFGSCRQVQNRLKAIATTNHDHAIVAGVRDRRNVVFDVSDERVGDKVWFDRLYKDLNAGGTSEFLQFLLSVKLSDWHPRQILKTTETIEQQRMSGDSVSQWAQACIMADAIVGAERGAYGADTTYNLGTAISLDALYKAYTGFSKGQHPASPVAFGKACAEMFGPRKRLKSLQSTTTGGGKKRPWGYHVPNGTKWQEKIDARLGIKN